MAAPANVFSFDLEMMREAGKNWHERTPARELNLNLLKQKRYDAVEPKERLAKRANRLLNKVKQAAPAVMEALPQDLRELVKRGPIQANEIDNFLFERVIGETRDFLSVEFLEKGIQANRCVGRIVTRLSGGRMSFGTGFLVSPRLLMTNWHVLRTPEDATSSSVEFDYQLDRFGNPLPVKRFKLDPAAFFLNHQTLDFALVAVEEKSPQGMALGDFGWCPLIKAEGKITQGDPVNIIQHPRGDMKQIVIRENRLVDLLETLAHYEGDTEPGSSGSPVFNDQWEVIALHHSGVPKMNDQGNLIDVDGNVWQRGDDPDRLAWVANEGIRVSRLMDNVANAQLRRHEEALRKQLLDQKESPAPRPESATKIVVADRPPEKETSTTTSISLTANSGVVTIPLTITISLGQPAALQATLSQGVAPADTLEKIEPDPDYSNRIGYDPDFLGFPVPLPKLMNSIIGQAVVVPDAQDGNKHELKYHHYSVIMNRNRRLAFVAAVNLDANARFKHKRDGKDRWFFDPRIDAETQAGNEFYSDNPLDRGHLVRRADAAWGDTEEEAKLANDDTFHFSNCSPQHEVYNQSTKANQKGVLLWGNIEEHIADQARENNKKVAIFNGPIFRANDRKHRDLAVPREFWKVVVFEKEDGNPEALAFVLSQASLIKDLPEEEFEVGPYRPFQVRVREIENKTKLDFGNLRNFDPLEGEGNESFFESGTDAVPIESLENIVF